MYTLICHDLIIKKIRLSFYNFFIIFLKLIFLLSFWLFFILIIFIVLIFFYKIIKKNQNYILLFFNGYINNHQYQKINEIELNKKERDFIYLIYFSDEMQKDSVSQSIEFFIDNNNYDEEEIIDDFNEIYINVEDININTDFIEIIDENNK